MESGEANYQELLKKELENLVREEKEKEKGNSDKNELPLEKN